MTEQWDLFGSTCQRCGIPCRPGGEGNPDALLLRRANVGVCVSCGVTLFIKAVPSLMMGIERNGVGVLRDPGIQAGYARLMASGHADAAPEEIDWDRVVTNWNLPDPPSGSHRGRRGKVVNAHA